MSYQYQHPLLIPTISYLSPYTLYSVWIGTSTRVVLVGGDGGLTLGIHRYIGSIWYQWLEVNRTIVYMVTGEILLGIPYYWYYRHYTPYTIYYQILYLYILVTLVFPLGTPTLPSSLWSPPMVLYSTRRGWGATRDTSSTQRYRWVTLGIQGLYSSRQSPGSMYAMVPRYQYRGYHPVHSMVLPLLLVLYRLLPTSIHPYLLVHSLVYTLLLPVSIPAIPGTL